MKRFIKRNYIFVFAAICISIVTFEIISGIINSGNKTERIIGVASTYSFWNMLSPSTETVDKIQNLKSILPIKYDYINDSEKENNNNNNNTDSIFKVKSVENKKYKSYILEKLRKLKAH